MRRTKLPIARGEGLLIEQVADETVVYDSMSKEAHCLSPLAAAVFAHCDGETAVDDIAELATARLGEPVDSDRVLGALGQLEERRLLDLGGFSRRTMLQKTALAGGVVIGVPLISSVVAPAAIAGNSATCAQLLCCRCSTSNATNKDNCCEITNVTVNCQCVFAAGDPSKYCKPAGQASFTQCNQPGGTPIPSDTICGQATAFVPACLLGEAG
jgi:hypothetical protein